MNMINIQHSLTFRNDAPTIYNSVSLFFVVVVVFDFIFLLFSFQFNLVNREIKSKRKGHLNKVTSEKENNNNNNNKCLIYNLIF